MSLFYQKSYQNLRLQLERLQESLTNFPEEREVFEREFTSLKVLIENDILKLDLENIDLKIRSQFQSISTEIYRSYRLLITDILFLKSARQSALITKRLTIIQDRLNQLIAYCQIIFRLG